MKLPKIDFESWADVLLHRAMSAPDAEALTYLKGDDAEAEVWTYEGLHLRARAVAAQLMARGLSGERALLLFPPGLDFFAAFFGCLLAKTLAVPVFPPSPSRLPQTLPRISAIATDSQAKALLTTEALLSFAPAIGELDPVLGKLSWIATDMVPSAGETFTQPRIASSDVAFLQYTSGSTAAPKGVIITHGNLLENVKIILSVAPEVENPRAVTWLPTYHDMGLIGGVLTGLYREFPATLLSPVDFLQKPIRWLSAISRLRGTYSAAPSFAFDLCVRKIDALASEGLDLSSWACCFVGAEPIRPSVLEGFADAFNRVGFKRETFFPAYGLAENTLIAAAAKTSAPLKTVPFDARGLEQQQVKVGDAEARVLVGCGRSPPRHRLEVVDPETLGRVEPGKIGEIWLQGPSVASGYWNQPALTKETFEARIQDEPERGPFLRTGDLGFVFDGELFVAGRSKDVIIVRGRNLHAHDLELTALEADRALKPGGVAAFGIATDTDERVIILVEADRRLGDRRQADLAPTEADLRGSERRQENPFLLGPAVPSDAIQSLTETVRMRVQQHHQVDPEVHVVAAGSIPKTSSGKLQRWACRAQFLAGTLKEIS